MLDIFVDKANEINKAVGKTIYTPMKVVDMFFWEIGKEKTDIE